MSDHISDRDAYWDAEAARFDDEPDHGLRDPRTRAAWAALLAAHLPDPPADVVDLGCGTGSLAVLLAETGHRVRGLDTSPRMVEHAAAKAQAAGCDVRLDVGDAARPPYATGSADVVLCRHVLWALPDPAAVLRRWVDLLRPGGRLMLVEGRWHTGGGIPAATAESLIGSVLPRPVLTPLTDPVLWGGPISDERYLVAATRP